MSDPWFKFYPSDWLSGTRGLTPAETGIYITLVAMMYENEGELKRDDARLSRRCGCTKAAFTKLLNGLLDEEKFTEKDGMLKNERVEKELLQRAEISQKRAHAGSRPKSEKEKKSQQNQQGEETNDQQLINNCTPYTRSQKSEEKNSIKKSSENGFSQLRKTYPVEASKFKEAEKLYEVVISEGVPHELIIFSANRVRTEHFSKKAEERKYTQRLNSWLDAQNFENDREAWERSKQPRQKRVEISEPKPILPDNHFLNKIAGDRMQ